MDFALLALLHVALLVHLLGRRPAGRVERWHGRLRHMLVLLLAVSSYGTLRLALPPGVPRPASGLGLCLDLAAVLALFVVVDTALSTPRAARLRRLGLGLGAASLANGACWFALGVIAQHPAHAALGAQLRDTWGGTLAPAAALAVVHGLAAALFIAWGIAAPELHEESPAWRRDDVLRLPCAALGTLVVLLALMV